MSISYHGVVGFKSKATLPSVETWGNNMSLLRDPPRSIQTRKIDKVGETSEITQMIQESGDRVNETIKVYARGVDPFAGVMYGNYGTMGGQYYGGQTNRGVGRPQAFLPYRIMAEGAVRLSQKDQRQLLPLSRQPRVWTSSFTSPGFTDFSKSAMCNNTNGAKFVKSPELSLKACIRPTATYHLETPVVESYEVKNVIKNPLHVAGHSGIQTKARFNGEKGEPIKEILQQPLRPDVHISQKDMAKNIDLSHFDTDKYTHEVLYTDVQANPSQNIQVTSIDDLFNVNTENNTKDQYNISYTTPQTSYANYELAKTEIELRKEIPQYEMRSGIFRNVHVPTEHTTEREYTAVRPMAFAQTNFAQHRMPTYNEDNDREYVLRPTIKPGGFDPMPSMPMPYHENRQIEFDSQKVQMRQKVYDMQQDRNVSLGNIPWGA